MIKELEMIEKAKGDHDAAVEEIARSSEIVRNQCEDINDELDEHCSLLEKIEAITEKNQGFLDRNSEKLDKLLENYSNSFLMCVIFMLIAVLVVLIII